MQIQSLIIKTSNSKKEAITKLIAFLYFYDGLKDIEHVQPRDLEELKKMRKTALPRLSKKFSHETKYH